MGTSKLAGWALLAEGVIAGVSQIQIGLSFGGRGLSLTVLGSLIVVLFIIVGIGLVANGRWAWAPGVVLTFILALLAVSNALRVAAAVAAGQRPAAILSTQIPNVILAVIAGVVLPALLLRPATRAYLGADRPD